MRLIEGGSNCDLSGILGKVLETLQKTPLIFKPNHERIFKKNNSTILVIQKFPT